MHLCTYGHVNRNEIIKRHLVACTKLHGGLPKEIPKPLCVPYDELKPLGREPDKDTMLVIAKRGSAGAKGLT